jgi:hypothetical protein
VVGTNCLWRREKRRGRWKGPGWADWVVRGKERRERKRERKGGGSWAELAGKRGRERKEEWVGRVF